MTLAQPQDNPVGWSSIYPPDRMGNPDPNVSPVVSRALMSDVQRLGMLGRRGPVTAADLPAVAARGQGLMDNAMTVAGAVNPVQTMGGLLSIKGAGTMGHEPPVVAWHGTRAPKPVVEFSQEAAEKTGRWTKDEAADIGFHFSPEKEIAENYGTPSRYHLKLEKPKRITEKDVADAQNAWLNKLEWSDNPSDQNLVEFIKQTKAFDNPGSGFYNQGLKILSDEAKASGYDGLIFKRQLDFVDDRLVDEYIMFNPRHITPAGDGQ